MNVTDMLRRVSLAKAYEFLDRDPDQNIPRLLDWLEKLDQSPAPASRFSKLKAMARDPDSNWFRLARSLWEDVDDGVRKNLFTNVIGRDHLPANPSLTENRRKYGCNIPWLILMEPTMAWGRDCPDSAKAEQLTFDEMDSVIEQGKALGTYFYAFSGGEPLLRRNELIALSNKHSECVFFAFTDGTRVDPELTEDLLRVRNLVLILQTRSLARESRRPRDENPVARLRDAMSLLREARLLFGFSCTYDHGNCALLGSEALFDELISRGAKFAWFFADVPVGPEGKKEGVATAGQRAYLHRQILEFRKSKPLFTLDFCSDCEFMGGCVAGGRQSCHINARGDLEPCAFTHFSDSNIRTKTLLEAYRSPLFMAYHRAEPSGKNRPGICPLLDDPKYLIHQLHDCGAYFTGRIAGEDGPFVEKVMKSNNDGKIPEN